MKTDKKVMAAVLRKVADNLDRGLYATHGIQYECEGFWGNKDGLAFWDNSLYRIKPETITLKNGVVIPKPLDEKSMHADTVYYAIYDNHNLYCEIFGSVAMSRGCRYLYATKEQAIEASKALFGIE